MKIEQLRYFLETARHEHVGKAAGIVHVSPSAVSHSIAALERELGRSLFLRKGKNVFLTSHGRLLMERAQGFLNGIEAMKDELASDQVDLQGHYRLAGTHLLASGCLTPAWSRVQAGRPGLTAELYSLRSAQVVAGVSSGEFDLGLCLSPQPHPSLEIEPVYEGRLVLAMRRGHPFAKKPRPLAELSVYPAVLPKALQGIDNCETHPVFKKFGIEPRPELVFDSYEVAIRRIRETDSWGLLPDFLAAGLAQPRLPKEWDAPVRACVLRPRHRVANRVLRLLAAELKRRFGGRG